jgi:pyruvate dehydrogenase E2 component (dihydrolipoamide acetyltransferase)
VSERNSGPTDVGNTGLKLSPWPEIDFAAFGPVETRPLSRIQALVGSYLSRNWVMIPHVTHHDDVDITALDAARARVLARTGTKVTALAFLIKAAAAALKRHPQFNASLDREGRNLVLKKYFHIGVAVETPHGLLVPVIRDVDRKDIAEIGSELVQVSVLARKTGLPMDRMSGGCFTISSLGSLGGTGFTPIINAPEVAILGVTRAVQKPVRIEGTLAWRTMLPLSLSYDHRVINGADAARFCTDFGKCLDEVMA